MSIRQGNNIIAGSYAVSNLPQATENTIGGIKAETKTSAETQEVKIDTTTGKLYVAPELPNQSGQNGKYLTTNGTDVSWNNVTMPVKISDLTDDTATNPIDKADTLTGLTATVTELNYNDGLTGSVQPQLDNKLNKQQITNCILEDPQNIKLELNNGTLTLKAGSVVCVPNGFESDGTTRKFDEVIVESDISVVFDNTFQKGCIVNTQNNSIVHGNIDPGFLHFNSGATAPSITWGFWYDTANNIIKFTSNSGATWVTSGFSFIICLATGTNGSVTSIDQTFQSIGYIGSTIFVRKGLKVLIPNGRNADGSLKNIEKTADNVITKTFNSTINATNTILGFWNAGYLGEGQGIFYNETENKTYYESTLQEDFCFIGSCNITSGAISNFQPCTATNILKYSDKSQISGWSAPSTRYIDLTLGASGATYTAPANGWFLLCKRAGTTNSTYVGTYEDTIFNKYESWSNGEAAWQHSLLMPVKRGQQLYISYSASGNTDTFRFIYAEGDK